MLHLVPLLTALAIIRAVPINDDERVLFVTDSAPVDMTGCLAQAYHGSYGGKANTHIYLPTSSCLDTDDSWKSFTEGHFSPVPEPFVHEERGDAGRLVWVGQAGVEGISGDIQDDWTHIDSFSRQVSTTKDMGVPTEGQNQRVLGGQGPSVSLVHSSIDSMILHVPSSVLPIIDTLLPAHLVPVAIPLSPLPIRQVQSESGDAQTLDWKTVPEHHAKHLANLTSLLKFDPALDSVLSLLDHDQVRRNVRWLTGEAPSGIASRHSFTEGAIKAGHWLKEQTEKTGAICQFEGFLPGFAPNLICTYPSTTNSTDQVILSAHYDSRGSFGSTVAPGGDDDGSGSGHLLAVAQSIGKAGVKFEKKVVLAFFAGEEQGLLGSHAHAERLYNAKETVLLHVQADMLAYHVPGEPLQLGLPESIHLPEASYLLGNLSHIYAPELLVGTTPACCSDHQSFLSYGYPASAVFERNGPIADPKYHNTRDVSSREGYDFEQIVSIAKVTMAALLTVGGWSKH